jgi:hypothetical protein
MKELAIGILLTIGIIIITIPIRMFADWLFEKLICKDCEHYKKDCENYKQENKE